MQQVKQLIRGRPVSPGAVSHKPDDLTFDHAVQICGGAFDIPTFVLASSALRG